MDTAEGIYTSDPVVFRGSGSARETLSVVGIGADSNIWHSRLGDAEGRFKRGLRSLATTYTDAAYSESCPFDSASSRLRVFNSDNRPTMLFARSARGRVLYLIEREDGDMSGAWNNLGGLPDADDGKGIVGNPVADLEGGALKVLARGRDHRFYWRNHLDPSDLRRYVWSPWNPTEAPQGAIFRGDPLGFGFRRDGGAVVFNYAVGFDGLVYGSGAIEGQGSFGMTRVHFGDSVGATVAGNVCIDPEPRGGNQRQIGPFSIFWRGIDSAMWAIEPSDTPRTSADVVRMYRPVRAVQDAHMMGDCSFAVLNRPTGTPVVWQFWIDPGQRLMGRRRDARRDRDDGYSAPIHIAGVSNALGTPAAASTLDGRGVVVFRTDAARYVSVWERTVNGQWA